MINHCYPVIYLELLRIYRHIERNFRIFLLDVLVYHHFLARGTLFNFKFLRFCPLSPIPPFNLNISMINYETNLIGLKY